MARPRRKHFKIAELPEELQAAINDRLAAGDTYAQITEFIRLDPRRPADISVSPASVARYGKAYATMAESTRATERFMRSLVTETGLDPMMMERGVIKMCLHMAAEGLASAVSLKDADPMDIIRVVAPVLKASAIVERSTIDVRKEAKAAAAEITAKARKGGLSEETIREIQERVLGIAR